MLQPLAGPETAEEALAKMNVALAALVPQHTPGTAVSENAETTPSPL